MCVVADTGRCSDNDENHADVSKRYAIRTGAPKQQAFVPARHGNRLFMPADTQERQTTDTAMVGHATVNANALSLFHMKQLRSPASYRRGRGALFYQPFPCRLRKRYFPLPPGFAPVFAFFTVTRLIGRLITCTERIVASSIEIGGWQIGCQASRETPVLALPYRAAKSHRLHSLGYDDYLSPVPSLFFYG